MINHIGFFIFCIIIFQISWHKMLNIWQTVVLWYLLLNTHKVLFYYCFLSCKRTNCIKPFNQPEWLMIRRLTLSKVRGSPPQQDQHFLPGNCCLSVSCAYVWSTYVLCPLDASNGHGNQKRLQASPSVPRVELWGVGKLSCSEPLTLVIWDCPKSALKIVTSWTFSWETKNIFLIDYFNWFVQLFYN